MMDLPEPEEFAAQLRALADRMTAGMAEGWGAAAVPPAPVPPPLSPSSIERTIEDLRERRAQLQSLQTALAAFDEQLAALETVLAPLHAWATAWSGVAEAAGKGWRPPS